MSHEVPAQTRRHVSKLAKMLRSITWEIDHLEHDNLEESDFEWTQRVLLGQVKRMQQATVYARETVRRMVSGSSIPKRR